MFFPYKDDNPRVLYPFVTYSIIILNIIVFLFQFYVSGNNPNMGRSLILKFGFVPNNFNPMDIITSMLECVVGFGHIIGNMWFLYIFGDNIEYSRTYKIFKFLRILRYCRNYDTIFHRFIICHSMVGASGAIAGILGAYMLKFLRLKYMFLP